MARTSRMRSGTSLLCFTKHLQGRFRVALAKQSAAKPSIITVRAAGVVYW